MRPVFRPSQEDWPFLRRLAWTIAVLALLVVVWRAAHLLILAFGSVLGAVVFLSAARLLRRAGLRNRRLALMLGIVLVLAIFGAVAWLFAVEFGSQIASMLGNLPDTLARIERSLDTTPVGSAIVDAVHTATGGGTIANKLGTFVAGGGEVLVNFLIVLIGAIFIAANPRPYLAGIVLLTPPAARGAMERALGEIGKALRLWLKAKLIGMAVMGALICFALWMAGLKSWAALGLLGGLSEFIPYVGPTLAMVPTIAIAATEGGDVLWRTMVGYLCVRLVEAYFLTPWVNRKVVKIPPALTLFVILAMGAVLGAYGLFFAGALLVVVFVGVRELYLRDTLGEDIDGLPHDAREPDQAE